MTESVRIEGRAAALGIENLDTDQIIFLEGLDVIGLSLTYQDKIETFARAHWARLPWLRDVASSTMKRL